MARSALSDPLEKFRWSVCISENSLSNNTAGIFTKAGFSETTVPGYNITTRSYSEGGAHLNRGIQIKAPSFGLVFVEADFSFQRCQPNKVPGG